MLLPRIEKHMMAHYRMLLSISHNPHSKEPRELWDALNQKNEVEQRPKTLDVGAFSLLKNRLSGSSKFIVK